MFRKNLPPEGRAAMSRDACVSCSRTRSKRPRRKHYWKHRSTSRKWRTRKPDGRRATRLAIATSPSAVCTGDGRPPRPSLPVGDSTNSSLPRDTTADTSAVKCRRSTQPSGSPTRRNFGRFGEVDDEVDGPFDAAAAALLAAAAAGADDCERASHGSSVGKYLI